MRRTVWLGLIICLVLGAVGAAQAPRNEAAWSRNIILQAIGYESISVPASSTGLTALQLTPADYALKGLPTEAWLTVETAPVRLCLDGTAASATACHLIPVGSSLIVTGRDNLTALRMYDATAAAVVKVSYFRVTK